VSLTRTHLAARSNWQESNKYSFKEDPQRDMWIVWMLSTAGAGIDEGSAV
jgi:hypothetical protein